MKKCEGLPPKTRWGDWKLRGGHLLCYPAYGAAGYCIDLDGIINSAALLDWIFQLRTKRWATAQVMFDLLSAFEDVCSPQAFLCAGGVDHKVSRGFFRRDLNSERCFARSEWSAAHEKSTT